MNQMFHILLDKLDGRIELLRQKNLEGQTPLTLAMCYGTPEMIKKLFDTFARKLKPHEIPLCVEMFAKRQLELPDATLKLLLNHRREQPSHTLSLLHIICQHENPKLLERLLNFAGNNPSSLPDLLERTDEHGYTPLLSAAYYGHQSMVELLLQKGPKYIHLTTHENKNLLHLIAEQQHYHVLESVGSQLKGKEFEELMSGQPLQATPLHEVCKTNNVELCRLMLSKCMQIKFQLFKHHDAYGRTVFHEACDHGRLQMIKYLTSDKLIPNKTDRVKFLAIGDDERRTCLHLAAAKGRRDSLRGAMPKLVMQRSF
jgi:ankyrin repeat protein